MKRLVAFILVTSILLFVVGSANAEGFVLKDNGKLPEISMVSVYMLLGGGYYSLCIFDRKTKEVVKEVRFNEISYTFSGMTFDEAETVAAFLLELKPEDKAEIIYDSEKKGNFLWVRFSNGENWELRIQINEFNRISMGDLAQTLFMYFSNTL
jgi:hypothetical protein